MDGSTFPETQCFICAKPVSQENDLPCDEKGNAVHRDCFFKRSNVCRDSSLEYKREIPGLHRIVEYHPWKNVKA